MAFVSVLQPDSGHGDLISGPSDLSYNVSVGYDDVTELEYAIFPTLIHDPAFSEIQFSFAIFDKYARKTRLIKDAMIVSTIVPPSIRAEMKVHLLGAIRELIQKAKPSTVMMCTINHNLPLKAERKYLDIAEMMIDLGYKVDVTVIGTGQKMWWMEQTQSGTVHV